MSAAVTTLAALTAKGLERRKASATLLRSKIEIVRAPSIAPDEKAASIRGKLKGPCPLVA
jgi:hypothetical protein